MGMLLGLRLKHARPVWRGRRGFQREKCFENACSSFVHFRLQFVHIFVETDADNVIDGGEGEIRTELAEGFFRRVFETIVRSSRDAMQRIIGGNQARVNGSRKYTIEEQVIDNAFGSDASSISSKHLERAGGTKDGRPLQIVKRGADIFDRPQEDEIFYVEDA